MNYIMPSPVRLAELAADAAHQTSKGAVHQLAALLEDGKLSYAEFAKAIQLLADGSAFDVEEALACLRRNKLPVQEQVEAIASIEAFETTSAGGKQHKLNVRFDALDAAAIRELAKLRASAINGPYPIDNWRGITVEDNLNHAEAHINKVFMMITDIRLQEIDEDIASEDIREELTHAFCRLMFALAVHLQGGVIKQ